MRLAILSPYTDPIRGGITSYTRELASEYRKLGIQTLGLAREGARNAVFDVIPGSKIAFCIKSTLRALRWKADVVHAHSHWYTLVPCLALKALRPQTRVLFTYHTPPMHDEANSGAVRHIRDGIFLALVHSCDGVAFVSKETQASVKLPSSVRHALVGAAPESLPDQVRNSVATARRGPVILAVSVLVWPKKVQGLFLLIDAFATVAPAFPEWRLVILGDGPLRAKLEERVSRLNLSDRIVMKGFVNNVQDEMASSSVFAQISLQEGLPIALLDAMALGLPVIATAVGGMPDVLQDRVTGFVVDPSREAVSKGLQELIRNPELRRRLGASARIWASSELSWEKVARKSLRLVGKTPP